MRVFGTVGSLVLAAAGFWLSGAGAGPSPIAGGRCAKAGAQTGGGPGVTLVCKKTKGKLTWQKLPSQHGIPTQSRPGTTSPPRTTTSVPTTTAGTSTTATTPTPGCTSSSVHFTANLIDPAFVQSVTPIGGQTGSGGVLAVRSYIAPDQSLAGQHLPIYAPVNMTLVGAAHYQLPGSPYPPEYSLEFDVGCGVTINLYHIKEISTRLQTVVPATPVPSSATDPVTKLSVTAGEQIGAYIPGGMDGHAFDFWVDDASVTNSFISPARYAHSNHLHAVCPYSFYVEPLRTTWFAKLGTNEGVLVPGMSCGTVSQGQLGTAQGQWFLIQDPAAGPVDVLTYDGTYMSQGVISIEADGTVRIGGFWSATYVIVPRTDPTWADPTTVTSAHCWADQTRSVTVQLDSPTVMRVYVASGACPASVPTDGWKTYYR